MPIILRPRQIQAIADTRRAMASGSRAPIICAPTGSGKTVIGAEIMGSASAKNRKALFLAHRQELITQARSKLSECGLKSGIIKAGERMELFHSIQVASVQTLVRRMNRIDWRPDLIMIDEAHLSNAASYRKIIEYYGSPPLIGLTATPQRLDGSGLGRDHGGLFDTLIIAGTPRELTEEGHLCHYQYFAPPLVDVSAVHTVAGEYDVHELAEITDQQHITGSFLEHWKEKSPGRPTIVFAVSVDHARHVAEQACSAGLRAVSVSGDSDSSARSGAVRDVQSGAIHMLVNCGLYIEGLDAPALSCMVGLAATKSMARFRQRIGRVMRPFPDKDGSIIFDHVGDCMRHGLPDADIEWSLEGRKRRGVGDISLTRCPECFGAHVPAPKCPHCSHVYAAGGGDGRAHPDSVEGQLIQITELEVRQIRKQELKIAVKKSKTLPQLLLVAKQFGYSEAWAINMLRGKQRARERFLNQRDSNMAEYYQGR